jgi:hypothetical protein
MESSKALALLRSFKVGGERGKVEPGMGRELGWAGKSGGEFGFCICVACEREKTFGRMKATYTEDRGPDAVGGLAGDGQNL